MRQLLLSVFGCAFLASLALSDQPRKDVLITPEGVDFYGRATFRGMPVQPKDVVTAYDSAGNLCGKVIVRTPGYYGYLCVYADDPSTPDVDEGAVKGETITFRINGVVAKVSDSKRAVWTKNHDRWELNLAAE